MITKFFRKKDTGSSMWDKDRWGWMEARGLSGRAGREEQAHSDQEMAE